MENPSVLAGWRAKRPGIRPRRDGLFTTGTGQYLSAICFTAVILTLFRYFGEGHVRQTESGIFVRALPYSTAMKIIREDDVTSLRVRVLPRFGQEPEITYDVAGNSLPELQAPGRIVVKKERHPRYSLRFEELGPVVESFLLRSVSKTVIIILDGGTPDAMSYEKLMQLCDLVKQKRCARIVITSPGFRWREPGY